LVADTTGFVDCFRQHVRENGWRSVWKGFGPCVSRAFPANAAGFLAYEIAAKLIRERQEEKDAAAATATAAATTAQ
jgi:solute carrier family 25 carnitine/acylcarnitine transporter 20/29